MRLRGVYNYTEAVLKEPSAKVDFARLNWISGCVVKRTERFGKDLNCMRMQAEIELIQVERQ